MLGICGEISYSAQAAIELEMSAAGHSVEVTPYPISITNENEVKVVRLAGMISSILQDVNDKVAVPDIALRFHQTIAEIIVEVCRLITGDTGLKHVVLSGGVFQNRLLQRMALARLHKEGYNVLVHHIIPCNDGGISLGQAIVANFTKD